MSSSTSSSSDIIPYVWKKYLFKTLRLDILRTSENGPASMRHKAQFNDDRLNEVAELLITISTYIKSEVHKKDKYSWGSCCKFSLLPNSDYSAPNFYFIAVFLLPEATLDIVNTWMGNRINSIKTPNGERKKETGGQTKEFAFLLRNLSYKTLSC